MLHTWELTIPQLEPADLRRRAYLYLPEAYDEDPDARFPVLYMFDGQNVFLDSDASFGRSWRMLDYLEGTGTPVRLTINSPIARKAKRTAHCKIIFYLNFSP